MPHLSLCHFSAEYSLPLSADWAGTLHGDYYWQDFIRGRVYSTTIRMIGYMATPI